MFFQNVCMWVNLPYLDIFEFSYIFHGNQNALANKLTNKITPSFRKTNKIKCQQAQSIQITLKLKLMVLHIFNILFNNGWKKAQ